MFWSFSMCVPGAVRSLCEVDALDAFERAVVGDDHAIARGEIREHFELLGVAPARLDGATVRGVTVGTDDEHPVPARALEECARRQHERFAIFAERKLALQRLAG